MENQLFEKNNRPAISACFIYLILGLLCCISLALTLVNLLNGEQVNFNVGQLIGGIFGLSMIYKGINGFQANQADNPLASSIIWFTWIAIGLPVAFTLFQLLLIFVDFGNYWVALFSLPMVIFGIKAISSIYQHLPDALYLAKSFVLLFAAGVFVVIVSYFAAPTTLLLYSSAFRIILAAGALIYIFKSSALTKHSNLGKDKIRQDTSYYFDCTHCCGIYAIDSKNPFREQCRITHIPRLLEC